MIECLGRKTKGADQFRNAAPKMGEAALCGPDTMNEMTPLCQLADLREGQARGFLPHPQARRQVIVMRRGDGVVAYWDSCPHYAGGTPMAWRKDAYLNGDGTHFACHAHGALFDIDSGECVLGPCLGRRLTRVPVEVRDGAVCIPSRLATPRES